MGCFFAVRKSIVHGFMVQQRINELTQRPLMSLADAVDVLVKNGIIKTADYWA